MSPRAQAALKAFLSGTLKTMIAAANVAAAEQEDMDEVNDRPASVVATSPPEPPRSLRSDGAATPPNRSPLPPEQRQAAAEESASSFDASFDADALAQLPGLSAEQRERVLDLLRRLAIAEGLIGAETTEGPVALNRDSDDAGGRHNGWPSSSPARSPAAFPEMTAAEKKKTLLCSPSRCPDAAYTKPD
jgi:hypothetical protein